MEYLKYPKIDKSEIQLLWHCNYWDGPITGLLKYQDKKYWFEMCKNYQHYLGLFNEEIEEIEEFEYFRCYTIHELTSEELIEEEKRHELFRTHVGTHTDYNENGTQTGSVNSDANIQEFNDKYKNIKPQIYNKNTVIGWFER